MLKKFVAAALATTLLTGVGAQMAAAQYDNGAPRARYDNNVPRNDNNGARARSYENGYDDGYTSGYRRGFDDARARRSFDDHRDRDANNGPPPPVVAGPPPYGDDRDARWRQRYARTYNYQDDGYYKECRNRPDPGGVIAGALIGGLLGNAVGRGGGQAGATVAGVIIGGAAGAALTSNMDCGDRSYAYKTYYDGFNRGRPNASYDWRNPGNGHRGTFVVGSYYNDPDGFRCATYSQVIYVNGRPAETRGRACQQPDGTWTIVN